MWIDTLKKLFTWAISFCGRVWSTTNVSSWKNCQRMPPPTASVNITGGMNSIPENVGSPPSPKTALGARSNSHTTRQTGVLHVADECGPNASAWHFTPEAVSCRSQGRRQSCPPLHLLHWGDLQLKGLSLLAPYSTWEHCMLSWMLSP